MDLAHAIYDITENLPKKEIYGLVSQMNRAAVSIPSNIAEGAGRGTDKDFSQFLSIAIGSLFELNTQIMLAERIGYIDNAQSQSLQEQANTLQMMIVGFRKNLLNS